MFGVGGVGLSAVQGARIAGARTIVAIDVVPAKLETALEFGATHTIDASQEDEPGRAVRALAGDGVDHAFEAIGLPETAREAFAALPRAAPRRSSARSLATPSWSCARGSSRVIA